MLKEVQNIQNMTEQNHMFSLSSTAPDVYVRYASLQGISKVTPPSCVLIGSPFIGARDGLTLPEGADNSFEV